ncbi:hypothetical protein DNI29_21235 [Hymenobacter sediminis]|uniref:hypothetical protein n=1 Tax=Hymenobacter sediminis TaxID=2218621 RepID=UPI000DA68024|nr:hypothetical protein [Hymenobacter sediminis]RPD44655.1 hypothetical protein DNI29_21235 [Hymenobacter sediminis]
MILLSANPHVSFYFHNIGCRTLEAVWSDHVDSGYFRIAILLGLSLVRQHQIDSWIADDRRLGPLNTEDLDWVRAEIIPALATSGLRRLAVIESEDRLNRMLVDEAYTTPLRLLNIEFRHFADVQSARTWACGPKAPWAGK